MSALPFPIRAGLRLAVGVVAIAQVVARDGVNHGSGALSHLRGLGPRARADARVAVRRIAAARALFGLRGVLLHARERAGRAPTQLVAGAPFFAAVAADPASRRLPAGAEMPVLGMPSLGVSSLTCRGAVRSALRPFGALRFDVEARRVRARRALRQAPSLTAPVELVALASLQVGIAIGMAMWAWAEPWRRRP